MPERECSVQRRNQKVIEEAPSSYMDPETRKKMGEQAVSLARICGYQSTGTVEFLIDKNKDFYFLEMNTRLQVEHPITEEITGVDLVEQQILIGAGYPLAFKQSDVKINGHAVEYRVYAEDPSRKFLPSIGFLKKYKEPSPHKDIRIDTGVQEGSEISMYYDPMISKTIAWGKDRKTALSLLQKAIDEYVIRGVVHNLGFCQSILRNKSFADGSYTTAFIPTFYPNGFKGDPLTPAEVNNLAISAHYVHNWSRGHVGFAGQAAIPQDDTVYVIHHLDADHHKDYRVDRTACGGYNVTDLASGQTTKVAANNFDFDYGSLLRFDIDGQRQLLQYEETLNDVNMHFSVKGSSVSCTVLDARQYELNKYMAPPKKIDFSKAVISPMPGSIVSIAVEVGQTVAEGQELFTIEAMKMQNLIKSQVDGKIKKIHVKPGVSVAVDQLLIEFV
jgi:propionyl-CoA carboxylase alpha chain